ncbi:MAG: VCBS repeat-containing protein, partial [Bacteroidia bacterium]
MWTGGLDWGDYDADGDLDFAVGGLITGGTATTKIYRNDAGTFTSLSVPLAGCMHGCVKWGDIDQDNDLDLVVAGSTGTEMYRNTGNGSFEQLSTTFPVIYYGNADFADYDLDGDADLLLSASANGLVIFRNDGGNFSQQTPALTTLVNGKAWWGDSDNDGDQDILFFADSSNTGINRVYLNNNGSFQKVSNTGLPMAYPRAFGNWADMNNDGYLDMIFSTLSGTSPILRVFLNNRNNTFTQLNTMNGVGYETGYLTAADFNADGYMDYMISGDNGSGRYFELMRGTSQQSFNSAASLTGLDNSWMAWGDYDVDGQMDGAYVGNTSTDEVFALGIFKQTNGVVN